MKITQPVHQSALHVIETSIQTEHSRGEIVTHLVSVTQKEPKVFKAY